MPARLRHRYCTVILLSIACGTLSASVLAQQQAPAQQQALAEQQGSPPQQAEHSRDERFRHDVAAMYADLVAIRRELHRFPELSNQEERTARLVALQLKELGLRVQTGIGGHGVVATLEGTARQGGTAGEDAPPRCVAIRADMDALPVMEAGEKPYRSEIAGVMHACGHDVHVTCALGTARLLAKHRDRIAGTVKFIFQGAEEGMPVTYDKDWGAKLMVAQGALENPRPSAIFALHCTPLASAARGAQAGVDLPFEVGQIGFCPGPASANSDRFQIVIGGQGAHGSAPQTGVDAIVVAAQAVQALQTIHSRQVSTFDPLVITIGTIAGGARENIIAERVEMAGTVRTHDEQVRDLVVERMHRALKGVTEANGATYDLLYRKGYPAVVNDHALADRSTESLRRLWGEQRVVQTNPSMGGEDFSYFSREIPGFYFRLGVANTARGITAGLHTAEFDVDEECLRVGVESLAALACDYLQP